MCECPWMSSRSHALTLINIRLIAIATVGHTVSLSSWSLTLTALLQPKVMELKTPMAFRIIPFSGGLEMLRTNGSRRRPSFAASILCPRADTTISKGQPYLYISYQGRSPFRGQTSLRIATRPFARTEQIACCAPVYSGAALSRRKEPK
jgi:hypothetical protein